MSGKSLAPEHDPASASASAAKRLKNDVAHALENYSDDAGTKRKDKLDGFKTEADHESAFQQTV